MKKEVVFQQISKTHCHVNLKKITGTLSSQIQSKIKNHGGKWDQNYYKFQLPLTKIIQFAKQLQKIFSPRSQINIQFIPPRISKLLQIYKQKNKLKKQIIIDSSFYQRYEYVSQNILKQLYQKTSSNKWLLFCPQLKINQWTSVLSIFSCSQLQFKQKQIQQIKKQNKVWLCSIQKLLQNYSQLYKYSFQNIICDDAEYLQQMINDDEEKNFSIRGYLSQKHCFFPIFSKNYLNNIQLTYFYVSLIKTKQDFGWIKKRYRRENFNQLQFLLQNCGLINKLTLQQNQQCQNKEQIQIKKNHFNTTIFKIKESFLQKIKSINEKHLKVNHKKVLQCAGKVKLSNDKLYFDSIVQIFLKQKRSNILWFLNYYSKILKIKIVVITQTLHTYKIIQNYCCQKQISYCHYQQPSSVIAFNINSSILVCLVKIQNLLQINPSQHKIQLLQNHGKDLQDYNSQQYQCLSSANNIFFPDAQWINQIRDRQLALKKCFHFFKGDIIRHYFILKGTYQQKWMELLRQQIIKFQLQQLNDQEQSQDDDEQNKAFTQILIAKQKEKYDYLSYQKVIKDIDEQYDNLQYEALKQKQERIQRKKKKKERKQKQKLLKQQQQTKKRLQKQKLLKQQQRLLQKQKQKLQKKEKQKIKKSQNQSSYLLDATKVKSDTQFIQISSSDSPPRNSNKNSQNKKTQIHHQKK